MYQFNFDQVWIDSTGVKKRLYELTQEEFSGIETAGCFPKYTLVNTSAGAEILRATEQHPWFNSYKSACNWIAKTYKAMLAEAKRKGLIK